jgi:hypothetical protein
MAPRRRGIYDRYPRSRHTGASRANAWIAQAHRGVVTRGRLPSYQSRNRHFYARGHPQFQNSPIQIRAARMYGLSRALRNRERALARQREVDMIRSALEAQLGQQQTSMILPTVLGFLGPPS